MQIPKLVVFDVDGTLIDWGGEVSAATHRVLEQLREREIPIALATGRPLAIAEATLAHVGGADWMACGNGSSLFEVATGAMLRDRSLPLEVVEPTIDAMRKRVPGVGIAIEVGDTIIEEHGFSDRVPEEPLLEPVDDALAVLPIYDGNVRRVIFFHADFDDRLDELAAELQAVADDDRCQVQFGGLPIVDISPAGDHKAAALQVLVEHLGIDAFDVIAFGDGGNDLEMLAWAGTGVAMGNARAEVHAAADHVTEAVTEGGIAAFLGPILGVAPSDEAPGTSSLTPAFPMLETERLLLREVTHADTDAMFAIHGDAELMKWFGEPVADREAAQELIELLAGWRTLPDPGVRWGLEARDSGDLIGSCGLFGWRRRDRSCKLGYELALHAQGVGYMTEALTTALAWGWEHMDLVRIEAQIHPENLASQRLAESLGFELEGRLRKAGFWSGEHHDLFVYSLIAD